MPSLPARTLPELVDWIRRQPQGVSYASYSPDTLSHILGLQPRAGRRFFLGAAAALARVGLHGVDARDVLARAERTTALEHHPVHRFEVLRTDAAPQPLLPEVDLVREPRGDHDAEPAEAESDPDPEAAEDFRDALGQFCRLYAFLAQVMPFTDDDLEKLYLYGRLLERRLPARQEGAVDLGEQVELTHLRITHTGTHDVSLDPTGDQEISGVTGGGEGKLNEHKTAALSSIVDTLNDRFGTSFTAADELHFEQSVAAAMEDLTIREQALANNEENFGYGFDPQFEGIVVDRHELNDALVQRFLGEGHQVLARADDLVLRLRDAEQINDRGIDINGTHHRVGGAVDLRHRVRVGVGDPDVRAVALQEPVLVRGLVGGQGAVELQHFPGGDLNLIDAPLVLAANAVLLKRHACA